MADIKYYDVILKPVITEKSMNAMASIGINDKNVLDRLLVSLRFVTDVSNGERPFWMHPIFVVGLFTAAIIALLYWFFGTELGCSMRATGSNSHMAQAQGINTNFAKVQRSGGAVRCLYVVL